MPKRKIRCPGEMVMEQLIKNGAITPHTQPREVPSMRPPIFDQFTASQIRTKLRKVRKELEQTSSRAEKSPQVKTRLSGSSSGAVLLTEQDDDDEEKGISLEDDKDYVDVKPRMKMTSRSSFMPIHMCNMWERDSAEHMSLEIIMPRKVASNSYSTRVTGSGKVFELGIRIPDPSLKIESLFSHALSPTNSRRVEKNHPRIKACDDRVCSLRSVDGGPIWSYAEILLPKKVVPVPRTTGDVKPDEVKVLPVSFLVGDEIRLLTQATDIDF